MVSFKIHLSAIKNTFLYFKIYYNTFKYIAIPSLHTFGVHTNTINILEYASIYVETILKPLYFALLYKKKTLFKLAMFNGNFNTSKHNFTYIHFNIGPSP
jgi:hypothetical protein